MRVNASRARCSVADSSTKWAPRLPATRSALAGSTRSRSSASTSSPRWSAAGVTTSSAPAGSSTRWNSGPLRGAKTFSSTVVEPVGQRQPLPGVGQRGGGARVGAGRAAQRRLGDVQGQAGGVRQRRQHRGEVVPGAGAGLHHQGVRIAGRDPARGGGQRGGERVVVAGGEEVGPGGDHLRAVPAVRGPAGEQVDVPLPGDVEAVPARAAQRPGGAGGGLGQRLAADRAAQPVEDPSVHVEARSGMNRGPARSSGGQVASRGETDLRLMGHVNQCSGSRGELVDQALARRRHPGAASSMARRRAGVSAARAPAVGPHSPPGRAGLALLHRPRWRTAGCATEHRSASSLSHSRRRAPTRVAESTSLSPAGAAGDPHQDPRSSTWSSCRRIRR